MDGSLIIVMIMMRSGDYDARHTHTEREREREAATIAVKRTVQRCLWNVMMRFVHKICYGCREEWKQMMFVSHTFGKQQHFFVHEYVQQKIQSVRREKTKRKRLIRTNAQMRKVNLTQ